MVRALRMFLVLLLATSVLVVVSGEVDATVPGGNGRIVYVSDADDIQGEIYIRDFAGGSPVRLTNNTLPDGGPVWSPDGTRIAFSRADAVFGTDVMVMDPDGSNVINLTSGSGAYNYASDWSPDGTKILFASDRSGSFDLWTMNADGSSPQQLTTSVYWDYGGAWSPDGNTIAFGRETASVMADLWLMDADGSNHRRLTTESGRYDAPVWSPDGTKLVYPALINGDMDIWIVGSDGSNRANLTNNTGPYDFAPAWSPDGSKIAFSSDRDGDYDLWTMNPDGSGVAHLTDHVADEHSVSWESVNRAPIAIDDTDPFVHRGHTVEIDVLANDSDPDGEPLTIGDIVRMPAEGTVFVSALGDSVIYEHNGSTVPPGHAVPYTDSFDYRVDDPRMGSAVATVQVWIYPYFDDVPQVNVFFEDVLWLATEQITQGCNPPDNTLYCPTAFVTRAQMAAFLVRARGYSDGVGANLFTDDDDSIFEVVIDQLGTAGVTRGCNPPANDRYCPGRHVTRGQMAAFLVRAFGLTDLGMHDLFVDDNGSVFEADIDALGATRVSLGCNPPANDRFCPTANVTRQQMAAFIHRAVTWGQE